MRHLALSGNRSVTRALVLASLLISVGSASRSFAEPEQSAPPDRDKTLELCEKGNFLEALPALRQLNQNDPHDNLVAEKLALGLLMSAHAADDVEKHKAVRIEARKVLVDARKNGDDSPLLQVLLDGIPEDGSFRPFSARQDVNELMSRGEIEFAQGRIDAAIESYKKAYKLDPTVYEAALFTGDMYFRQKKAAEAGEWFERAIAIDPDCETAYRYWGDTLMDAGKMEEARRKFIDGAIANPYSRASWLSLGQWAKAQRTDFTLTRWTPTKPRDDAPAKDRAELELSERYQATRAKWKSETFKSRFPTAKAYRHTATEEVEALAAVVDAAGAMTKTRQMDLAADTHLLVRIKAAGLLEPYVYLVGADRDIAQEYTAYRKDNRPKLRQFIEQFILGKTQSEKP